MAFEILKIVNQPVTSNCFLLFDKEVCRDCIVIDPGSPNPELLEDQLRRHELHPQYILLTHEHFDHIWGCNYLIEHYQTEIICSSACSQAIMDTKKNCSLFYNQVGFRVPQAKIYIENIEFAFEWNSVKILFFIAEGHSPGGICIVINKKIFTGDTLIKDLKTVTKLPGSSKKRLTETIECIKTFQGQGYTVYPGHGEVFELDGYDLTKSI